MAPSATLSDADILGHLMTGPLSPDAARAILKVRFDAEARKQIRQLLRKNNRGTISAAERIALEKFVRIGKLIDLLHAKARVSLKDHGPRI